MTCFQEISHDDMGNPKRLTLVKKLYRHAMDMLSQMKSPERRTLYTTVPIPSDCFCSLVLPGCSSCSMSHMSMLWKGHLQFTRNSPGSPLELQQRNESF
jgi:hypothetical protein